MSSDRAQLGALATLTISAVLSTHEDTEALIARLKSRIRELESEVAERDERIHALGTRVKHLTAVFS